jgi:hypothetical protein
MADLQKIFNDMLEFFELLADQKPELTDLVNNFMGTRSVNVFLSILRSRPEIEPLLFCHANDKEKEAKRLIHDLMISNNVDKDLITVEEFSRFAQYIILWVEIIASDDGSDDE